MLKQVANAFVAKKLDEMTSLLDSLEAQGFVTVEGAESSWPLWAREKMHNINACLQCAYRDLSDLDGGWN